MYNNIQNIRKKKNISQKELAKRLKVTQQAVSYMENKDIENIFPEMKLLDR